MPTRQPGNRWSAPLPPEPPAEPSAVEHRAIASYDLWEDERVVDADLAGQVADQVRFTRCELQGVVLTGAQLRGTASLPAPTAPSWRGGPSSRHARL